NEAEYQAVIEALKLVSSIQYPVSSIMFVMDSKLVCEQLSGRWKIKQDHLRELFHQVKSLELELGVPITYTHVLRDKNKRADELLNKALDTA
ncbi:MAG: ribonuclease HI family protein, partial [Candidatus Roizmanbacteria bacterium]|nr:ribonuclease HI family protein [Candidatus Roizmanbacteria bacterium]